jgi:RNA polymerase sigma-70 factor (ECF subfamily)
MADPYTKIGGEGNSFPSTCWSVIREAKDPDAEGYRASIDQLATLYWRPVYAYFRCKWGRSNEEAKDLTQEFFLSLNEREILQRLSPEHGRFRGYVKTMLDNSARMDHRRATAQKRGGDAIHFSFDVGGGFDPPANEDPQRVFVREWTLSILEAAVGELKEDYRARGLEKVYEMFHIHEVDPPEEGPPEYEALAEQFGVSPTDVRNNLHRARKRLRDIVLNRIRDTVTSEEEAQEELNELFGDLAS